uniref:Uncharacterized protein n=1 Tax=Anguilla anguilla TaxID=7936 RepID=A0A0E9XBV9_ANGAN
MCRSVKVFHTKSSNHFFMNLDLHTGELSC